MKQLIIFILTILSICSCKLSKSPKNGFVNGFYKQNVDTINRVVYVDIQDETLRIHPTKIQGKSRIIDTTEACQFYKSEMRDDYKHITTFSKNTLDIDFLTIPLKYRPIQNDIPPQLNTNLNGAVYLGYRTDKYTVSYAANPLKKSDRYINHYGFSMGIFSGIGNTAINSTNSKFSSDYDGIVWNKGVAGIFAINNFTVGLSVGFDNLLDKNKKTWVYESKPWFGLAFGLNLN